jgi:hypothetical protein
MKLEDFHSQETNICIFENLISAQVSDAPAKLQLWLTEPNNDSIIQDSFKQEALSAFHTAFNLMLLISCRYLSNHEIRQVYLVKRLFSKETKQSSTQEKQLCNEIVIQNGMSNLDQM